MMFEEMHTYRHTWITHDYTDYLKCRILQNFVAKLDAPKNDDSNRGAIQSLQEI